MGNAGGSLHFGGDDEEEGEEDVVGQPGQAEGSGDTTEDRNGDISMTMARDHLAAQSVSILVIREHIHRSPCYCQRRITYRKHYRCTSIHIPRCKADFSAHLCVKTVEQRGHSSVE